MQEYIPNNVQIESFGNITTFKVAPTDIVSISTGLYHKHLSLKMITATDERTESGCFKIWYVFGIPGKNQYVIPYVELQNTTQFPSLATVIPQSVNYERK